MDIQHEEWKPVVGFEDRYEVSNTGKVRSITRTYTNSRGATYTVVGKELTQEVKKSSSNDPHNYHRVTLITTDGKLVHKSVHRLVAEAYIPNPENKPQINHIDCVKDNNNVCNLEWCTPSENLQHASNHGLMHDTALKGEDAVLAKFTNDEVAWMRQLYDAGVSVDQIAAQYDATRCTINNAIFGRSYKSADELWPPCTPVEAAKGAKSKCASLSQDIVDAIREEAKTGVTQHSLAIKYNVSDTTIYRIVNNLRY